MINGKVDKTRNLEIGSLVHHNILFILLNKSYPQFNVNNFFIYFQKITLQTPFYVLQYKQVKR